MGLASSKYSNNDFELVIRAAKELEWLLETEFGARGKGLHEKISSVPSLPPTLVKEMRYLATIRNKLIHEKDFNQIPDRARYIEKFEASAKELQTLVKNKNNAHCVIC
mmetsp:Transcript_19890/g.43515  ORF Transcript_19890/g.43515 Transcript_19890/m.43515 type:complete len:108 (-) Transcript_19890:155-478(-)|eukprot:CAMPEP_0118922054 /NCGR_PEP_ID=MMETSP1169-20130426/1119_1 /TAXON_ID=36882 /ORGANISM="Pyramimonas obovata, Strain CCMP722" /LENGTH=107 /DNA_ID=CAMNT_0006862869 /DNA_START=275 /DNA_END=598 /DNA_ORIENTATION=+